MLANSKCDDDARSISTKHHICVPNTEIQQVGENERSKDDVGDRGHAQKPSESVKEA